MGKPWATPDQRQQQKTQETLPTAGFPLERMTRFELATLTLATLRSPSAQSVQCAAVSHSPQNRPGNPSSPSSSYTGLPSSRSEASDESRHGTPSNSDSIAAMPWGTVELEPEVVSWLDSLTDNQFGQAERYIDLLGDQGVHLSEPFTRQLDGKLRELRFYLDRQPTRLSYYIATGRIIVLLTVFTKTRPRERAEIDRARRAMQRCITDSHLSEEQPT